MQVDDITDATVMVRGSGGISIYMRMSICLHCMNIYHYIHICIYVYMLVRLELGIIHFGTRSQPCCYKAQTPLSEASHGLEI